MSDSSDESMDEEEACRSFEEEAKLIIQTETLPKKSGDRYNLVYDTYKKWHAEHTNSLSSSEEDNLIVYFKELIKRLKPSTIWSIWSMLKKTLIVRENVDLTKFHHLRSIVKQNSKGHRPKKSQVLTWDQIQKFMDTASDFIYLASKILLVFGLCGACRCDELTNLKAQNVEDIGNSRFLVSIEKSKNDDPRQFIIGKLYYDKVKLYNSLRPTNATIDRYFMHYKDGKCINQVIGRNKIGDTPQNIASFLHLPNPKLYTGHCFRRTGTTLCANAGGNVSMIQQLGGWKSSSIALGYVQNSTKNREKIFDTITSSSSTNNELIPQPSTSSVSTRNELFIPQASTSSASTNNEIIPKHHDSNSTHSENNFSEDFEFNEDDVAAIEKLNQSEVNEDGLAVMQGQNQFKQTEVSLVTARHGKLPLSSNNSQKILSKHFTYKKPVMVSFKGAENEPPIKKTRYENTTCEQESFLDQEQNNNNTKPSLKSDLYNKYDNCVFNGDIITNIYYCNNCKNSEKK